jgi:phosphonopyruvate decarboxylase
MTGQDLARAFNDQGISFLTGVPDSILSPLIMHLEQNAAGQHQIAANEGNAVGLGIGYFLATGKLPVIYMQNSGLNNALDPLTSLVHSSVMQLPLLLLIGWRGRPGTADEPQHAMQGRITESLLDTVEIPHLMLNSTQMARQIEEAATTALASNQPFALLMPAGFLEACTASSEEKGYELTREDAVKLIAGSVGPTDIVVATNGKLSRELYEYRDALGQDHSHDLLLVGGMGHALSVAAGIARQTPRRNVHCLDGDGSIIMHLGGLVTTSAMHLPNLCHFVLNNESHDSTGGQATAAASMDLSATAIALGYRQAFSASSSAVLKTIMQKINSISGPSLVEVRVRRGARAELGRPAISPRANKQEFMRFVRDPS